ncbi:type VII secretion protein EssC [Paenibacillus xylaniclasticus]|uniref:type VII secretion protein EssC n=1 Tax=Paenibacillus xylaniclasticus TaxID=588083 RepID=UPI000FD7DF12|nr:MULTISPECIES: type VII secretion protein EssC [Paenibacillus]GFN30948.1 type VII secretion protein EssC [Paenibacillus curdlanolyticus]
MQLSLLKDNALYTCVLPEKQNGQYWVVQTNEHDEEERVIGVEGVEGQWILKSNRNAVIQDQNRQRIKELPLEAPFFYSIYLRKTNETVWLYSEPISDDRKHFRKFRLPEEGRLVIGRAEDCDIQFASRFVSSRHAELQITNGQLTIIDLGSANGTFVNGSRIQRKSLMPGDVIYLIGLKIIVGQGFLSINNPDGQMLYKPAYLMPYSKQQIVQAEDEEELLEEELEIGYSFYRSPRFKRDIETVQIVIDPPPSKGDQEMTPLMLTMGPSITMGMSSAFMAMYSLQNAMQSGNGMRSAMPSLVMSGSMLTGAILWPILTRKYEIKKRAKRESLRQHKYSEYLKEKSQEIAELCAYQSQILNENHVTVDNCVTRIKLRQRNLWERTHHQNDFARVRLGIGQLPLQAEIQFPTKRFSLEDDNLQDELFELANAPKVLDNVPITLSLIDDWITGCIGNRSSVIDMVKGIIWQLVSLHSYDELKLVFIYDKSEQEEWEFVKWLPHLWNNEQTMRYLATTPNEVKELSAFFEKEIARRDELSRNTELKEISPQYIIVAVNKKLASKAEMLNQIYKSKKYLGFSVLHLYDELKNLPLECSMVVEYGGNASKIYDKDDISGKYIAFQPDFYLKQDEHDLAVSLANTKLDSADAAYALPTMLTFLEMFEVGKIEHLNALTRWKENDPTKSLETEIGVSTTGEKFKLDLHEKFHGPHGLIAGMTGSGKSEFIMTFILSLAVNYHPHEVAFILIDYKGGGMAHAFATLPHLAGTITNLDGAAVKRSLISIESELKRRQAIFSETSKLVGISNIDIYKYQKLYREGQVQEPLQHLFIISDEFAELKTQQPEFMEKLVSAARIGRSLGVHLILATQKPSGVVDDQIWSNSKFRICLKVQEKADSMDMIKRPDAAELSITGRYYVQVGFNELFELGQSAWGGAPYIPSDRMTKNKDDSITVIDNLGRVTKQVRINKDQGRANPPKQIDEINKYLAAIAAEENIKIRQLWLEPIPAMIVVDELKAKYGIGKPVKMQLNPVIGEIDDPVNQRQLAMRFPLSQEGNAVIFGSAGNGKTTFVTTLVYSLITEHSPSEVNLYLLDYGSETLRAFAKAPHVGEVLLSHDMEKTNNLFKMLYREIERRKKLFADYGGDYHSYVRSSGQEVPAIVTIIHNFSAFTETHDDKDEAINYLTREGVKYGLYFILTATTSNAVRYRTLQNFKQLFVLQMNDPTEYGTILGNIDGLIPSQHKGRGVFKTDRGYEFQIAHVDRDVEHMFENLRRYCQAYADSWTKPGAPRVPILPDRIDAEFLVGELDLQADSRVPIGIEKGRLSLSYYSFDAAYVTLALSNSTDNATFAQGLAEVMTAQGRRSIVVLDPEEKFEPDEKKGYTYYSSASEVESHVVHMFRTLVERNNSYKDAIANGEQPPVFDGITYIIYSMSALMSRLSDDAKDKLQVLLEKGEAVYQVSFVLFDSVSSFQSIAYDSWVKAKVSFSDGIWIGDGIGEQYQMKPSKITSEMYQEIGNRFGYRLQNGKATLIKLLSSVTMTQEGEGDE